MFTKTLNIICRTAALSCILLFISVTYAGADQIQSSSNDYVVPQFGPSTQVDGKDIAPYQLSSEQIRAFLDKIKNREAASAVAYGHTVFREHGRLPEDYRNLLSDYFVREFVTWNRQNKNGVYLFDASQGHALHLVTDSNRGILKESTTTGRSYPSKRHILPEVISDTNALQLMRNYIEFHNTKYQLPEDYFISTAEFGKWTRFLYLTTKDPYHPYTLEFIMYNRDGGIYEKDLRTITWTCRREFPNSKDPLLHKIIIETFLRLHDKDQRIISGTENIPGYDKAKLDLDLEKTVRPMFSFVKRRGYGKEKLIYVVYTYEQDGGIVRRYRFPFKNKEVLDETPTCVVIGQDIGEAYYRL
ncbi:MAG: hypothetical protein WBC22_03655 [Sedimentisphaerales bacterium]